MTYFLSHPTHEHPHSTSNILLSLRHSIDDLLLHASSPMQTIHALTSHHQILYPRFDLTEDARNYYLTGDLPGLESKDLHIETRDEHSLTVEGIVVPRAAVGGYRDGESGAVVKPFDAPLCHSCKHEYNKNTSPTKDDDKTSHVDATNPPTDPANERPELETNTATTTTPATAPPTTNGSSKETPPASQPSNGTSPPPSSQKHFGPGHPNPASFAARVEENSSRFPSNTYDLSQPQGQQKGQYQGRTYRILIQERQTGQFARTFRFPHAIVMERGEGEVVGEEKGKGEGKIEAVLSAGVLRVVVPKKVRGVEGGVTGEGAGRKNSIALKMEEGEDSAEGRERDRQPFGLVSSQMSYF